MLAYDLSSLFSISFSFISVLFFAVCFVQPFIFFISLFLYPSLQISDSFFLVPYLETSIYVSIDLFTYFLNLDIFVMNSIVLHAFNFCILMFCGLLLFLVVEGVQDVVKLRAVFSWSVFLIWISLFVFGMLFMLSSDFLLIFINFVGLNLVIYSLLITENSSRGTLEGALKYFFLSTISSLFFIGGIAVFFAVFKTTNLLIIHLLGIYLQQVAHPFCFDSLSILVSPLVNVLEYIIKTSFVVVFVLLFLSFVFKLSLFPLHSWAAEVYSLLSYKLLFIFIVVLKWLFYVKFIHIFIYTLDLYSVFYSSFFFRVFFSFVIGGSVFVGSITALFEDKLRKIIAFSSTNNMGFVFIGFLGSDSLPLGNIAAPDFYLYGLCVSWLFLLVYLLSMFTLLIAFSVSSLFLPTFKYVKDISNASFLVLLITIILFLSTAGLPPFAGFFSKFLVITFAWTLNYSLLSFFAICCSAVSCYYYLRIVKIVCFDRCSIWLLHRKLGFLLSIKNQPFCYDTAYLMFRDLFILRFVFYIIVTFFIAVLLFLSFFYFFLPFLFRFLETVILTSLYWLL